MRTRTMLSIIALGVWLFPILTTLVIGTLLPDPEQDVPYTIHLKNEPSNKPGVADKLVVTAPPGMELAVYLNDRILDVEKTNVQGNFTIDLPVLPQRINDIAVIPTQVDSSTLPLLYDPHGFQTLHIPPDHVTLERPFLAASLVKQDGLHIYGSSIPNSQLLISPGLCQERQQGIPTVSDNEGSFHAVLSIETSYEHPTVYCFRVSLESGESKEFSIPAPPENITATGEVWKRSLEAYFTPQDVRLIFSVEMPDGYLIYRNLAEGNISEIQFLEYVFGRVTINTYLDPRTFTWRQEKIADSNQVCVILETPPLLYLIPEEYATTLQLDATHLSSSIPPYNITDRIISNLDKVKVYESKPPPEISSDVQQIWLGTIPKFPVFTLWVTRNPQPLSDPVEHARLLNTVSGVISGLQIRPPVLLRETLEGQIVGLLPARSPRPVQAQIYDIFKASYQADPMMGGGREQITIQTFLRDIPMRLPSILTSLFFGMMWLVPALLVFSALHHFSKDEALRFELSRLAIGSISLGALLLDWTPIFSLAGLESNRHFIWLMTALLNYFVIFLPFPKWSAWLFARASRLSIILVIITPLTILFTSFLCMMLPDGCVTVLLTGLTLVNLFMMIWYATQIHHEIPKRPPLWLILTALAVILGFSLPVQSLPLRAQLTGLLGVSVLGAALVLPLIPVPLLIGIVQILRHVIDRPIGTRLSPVARDLGRILAVGFAIGLSPAWGFIPIALITGLILFEWLLPPGLFSSNRAVSKYVKEHQESGVKQLLLLNRQTRLWRAAESNTRKLVREGKLEDKEYHALREEYERSVYSLEHPKFLNELPDDISLQDVAFNFGAGPRHSNNLTHALAWGLILAAPLILIQGWPLASSRLETTLPFPFLNTGIRLIVLIAQYLAGASFIGYFFPDMRGRNGMEKGGWMAAVVAVSFLPYHLLYDVNSTDWIAALIWAGSLLAFYLLIGLLAFDVRTLSHFKLGWFRLPDLYDFGSLALYLTGSGTPFITTTLTALFGNLEDLIPSLLKVVFPSFTLGGAQFDLLQMLLDLARQITSGV